MTYKHRDSLEMFQDVLEAIQQLGTNQNSSSLVMVANMSHVKLVEKLIELQNAKLIEPISPTYMYSFRITPKGDTLLAKLIEVAALLANEQDVREILNVTN